MTDIAQGSFATQPLQSRDNYISEPSSANTGIDSLSRGLNDAANTAMKFRDKADNAEAAAFFNAEDTKLASGVEAYQTRMRQLQQDMLKADPAAAAQIMKTIEGIRAGAEQGVYSPSRARLMYHMAAKDASQNPVIASQARTFIASFSGEMSAMESSAENDKTATEKGQDQLASAAAKDGKTVPQFLQDKEEQETTARAAPELAARMARGNMLRQEVEMAIGHGVRDDDPMGKYLGAVRPSVVTEAYDTLNKLRKKGASTEQMIQTAMTLKATNMDAVEQSLYQIANDPDVVKKMGGVVLFDTAGIQADLGKPYDDLIKMITTAGDHTSEFLRKSEAARTMTANRDWSDIHAVSPLLAQVWNTGGAGMMTMLGQAFQLDKNLKAGLKMDYKAMNEAIPGSGDIAEGFANPKIRRIMMGNYSDSVIAAVNGPTAAGGAAAGRPDAKNPPQLQAMADKTALYGVISDNPNIQEAAGQFYNFMLGERPMDGIAANPQKFAPLLKISSKARDQLDHRYRTGIMEVLKGLTPEQAGKISYNSATGAWKIDPSLVIASPRDTYGVASNYGLEDPSGTNPGGRETQFRAEDIAKYLNNYDKIIRSYDPNPGVKRIEIAEAFKDALVNKGKDVMAQVAGLAADQSTTYTVDNGASGKPVIFKNGAEMPTNTPLAKHEAAAVAEAYEAHGDPITALNIWKRLGNQKEVARLTPVEPTAAE